MNSTPPDTDQRSRKWSIIPIVTAAIALWVIAVEVPARLDRITDVREETTLTWSRHAMAMNQQDALSRLRIEHDRVEEQLASIAGTGPVAAGPSVVLDQIENAARSAGLSLLEMRPLEGERGGAYSRLPIQLSLAGSFVGLNAFLRTIETGSTTMPVREVLVRGAETESATIEAKVVLEVVIVEQYHIEPGTRR